MTQAWIAGEPAALDDAIAEAAQMLDASRFPLIAGLGTDVAGARAAIALAEQIGAAIDHIHSDAVLRDLDVMRSSPVVLTTPGEAQMRADALLLVGAGLAAAWPELPQRLLGKAQQRGKSAERRIFCLCPGRDLGYLSEAAMAVRVGNDPSELPALLATLRARLAGRPVGSLPRSARKLDDIARSLQAARFGVAVWSAAALDALTIEMLCGIVNDLNATTRFAGLPLAAADNAVGVLHTCGWMTGMPMRTAFGRGFPEHDPWLFDGERLVASGETDCVLWISSYGAPAPNWRRAPPMIALTSRGAKFSAVPRLRIEVGEPGVDHAGVEHLFLTGTLTARQAAQASERVSAADAILRITSALSRGGAQPC